MNKEENMKKIIEKIEKFRKESEEFEKRRLEEARNIAKSIIPSIKKDLGDDSIEITVENQSAAGMITGPKSFSLKYTRFLPTVFRDKPDYDDILGLSQHENMHLDKEFPNTVMREVMVDMAAAETYGPYALFSFQIRSLPTADFTSPWLYSLGSLVNLKPLLSHESQKKLVEYTLKTNYPHMLTDMLELINFEVPEGKRFASRKLGEVVITPQVKEEMKNIFSEFIEGLSVGRKYIEDKEIGVSFPFSDIRKNAEKYVKNYEKIESALILK